jgi:hypothetical protein
VNPFYYPTTEEKMGLLLQWHGLFDRKL